MVKLVFPSGCFFSRSKSWTSSFEWRWDRCRVRRFRTSKCTGLKEIWNINLYFKWRFETDLHPITDECEPEIVCQGHPKFDLLEALFVQVIWQSSEKLNHDNIFFRRTAHNSTGWKTKRFGHLEKKCCKTSKKKSILTISLSALNAILFNCYSNHWQR